MSLMEKHSYIACPFPAEAVGSDRTYNLLAEDVETVLKALIAYGCLDPLAMAHEAADSVAGLCTRLDGPRLSSEEALLWCAHPKPSSSLPAACSQTCSAVV